MKIIFAVFLILLTNSKLDLSKLETKDTDKKVQHKSISDKYFTNKYKTYYKKDLQNFFYEFVLGFEKLPNTEQMKNWNADKRFNLQLIDEYLEENDQEKYTQKQVLQLIDYETFLGYKIQKFREVTRHARQLHKEKHEEIQQYHREKKEKKNEKKVQEEFMTGEL